MHAKILGTVCYLKTAVLNLACIFSLQDSPSTGQPSAVDSSLSLSHRACAAPSATFHLEEEKKEEGGIKQDICHGRNQEQTKLQKFRCKN